MNVINIIDYDNITDYENFTKDYNNTDNCTNSENKIERNIPTLFLTIPCGLSFLCLMSLMVYTMIKPLLNNN